jgi:hypothetical protein
VSRGYGRAWAKISIVYSSVFATKDWIDAKSCQQSSSLPASCGDRLMGTLETTDTQLASSPAAPAPRVTLSMRLCCDRSKDDFPAKRVRLSVIALVLWSLASPQAASGPRVVLSPRLRTSPREHKSLKGLTETGSAANTELAKSRGAFGDFRDVVWESFEVVGRHLPTECRV